MLMKPIASLSAQGSCSSRMLGATENCTSVAPSQGDVWMSDRSSDRQDKYISISKAQGILNASPERITWFIATEKLSSIRNPKDRNQKLVSLQDTHKLLGHATNE